MITRTTIKAGAEAAISHLFDPTVPIAIF